MSATGIIRYWGVRRDGKSGCGASEMDAAELVLDLFKKGWRLATLTTEDGIEVGGIAKVNSRRVWWAELSQGMRR